ncbi:MAG: hypothetical protein ACRD2X_01305 [Vicinamibacteraceae bacterium]
MPRQLPVLRKPFAVPIPGGETVIRGLGLACAVVYGSLIVWLYSTQPRTLVEVAGGVRSSVGLYRVDQQHFDDGLRFFRADKHAEARAALDRADPAKRDAITQFYVAYSYLREGWGRFYNDDELFKQALVAVNRAIAVSPDGRVVVEDPDLTIKSADELKAELERGLKRDLSDLNPMKALRQRP